MSEPLKFLVEMWLVDGKLECKNITPFTTSSRGYVSSGSGEITNLLNNDGTPKL